MTKQKKENEFKGLTMQELEELRHKNRMEEIQKETDGKKEVEKLRHQNDMEMQRIRSSEIRKSIDRKANFRWMNEEGNAK